jgi:hypothetical protein
MGKHGAKRLYLLHQMTTTLGIKNRVNEPLGITAELKSTSQVVGFIQ